MLWVMFVCMRAPGCGGARPLPDSARAVLERRAENRPRLPSWGQVDGPCASLARPLPAARLHTWKLHYSAYTDPFLLHVLSQCRLFVTTGLCAFKTLREDYTLTVISTLRYKTATQIVTLSCDVRFMLDATMFRSEWVSYVTSNDVNRTSPCFCRSFIPKLNKELYNSNIGIAKVRWGFEDSIMSKFVCRTNTATGFKISRSAKAFTSRDVGAGARGEPYAWLDLHVITSRRRFASFRGPSVTYSQPSTLKMSLDGNKGHVIFLVPWTNQLLNKTQSWYE